jgi:hypothetical protein
MKANGRRRWRKWARGRRKHAYGDQRAAYSREVSMTDRRHRSNLAAAPIQARPFSQLSLVGMSNACRKWCARVDLLRSLYGEEARVTWDRKQAKRELIAWSRRLQSEHAKRIYQAARENHRVGVRLRLCPGCLGCAAADAPHYIAELCDGSGVLPASRATGGRGR